MTTVQLKVPEPNPVTVMGDWDWVAVAVNGTEDPVSRQLAVYPEMMKPVGAVGAVKAMVTCPLPVVTTTLLGAVGTVAVSAKTQGLVFIRSKATQIDLKCVTGVWRAMFIGLSLGWLHRVIIEITKSISFD